MRLDTPPDEARDPDGEDVFDGEPWEATSDGRIANVAGVKFRAAGTIHEYDAGELSYARGERVIVESERGSVVATIAVGSRRMPASGALHRILRRATPEELSRLDRNADREREALRFARECARARKLPIKLVRAEYGLSSGKLAVYFSVTGDERQRVDTRDLGRELSTRLRARVELRQVGARDEARMVGGIGSCGRELCCSTFLPSFAPVSIKMAKDQGLVLNPTRVTGQCGRLKCCLVYEQDLYAELRKTLPKIGKRVRTPGGSGKVVELDVLRQRVRVLFVEGGSEFFPGDVVETLAAPEPGKQ